MNTNNVKAGEIGEGTSEVQGLVITKHLGCSSAQSCSLNVTILYCKGEVTTMIEFVGTIIINKTPDEVFRFIAHREHFLQWVRVGSGTHSVSLSEGAFGDGTLIQHTQVVSRVSHLHVNQGFETETIRIHFPGRLLIKHMHDRFQFEPVGQGTQVTLIEQIGPTPLLKPFAPLVARRAHQVGQALLENLKTLLEQETR